MNLSELTDPIDIGDIDFRIINISTKGVAIFAPYKDARVDIKRLNQVCGPLNWKREHSRDNRNCSVSIWDEDKRLWVSKEDTGTESQTEKEKGLASDSFKRACFNWGIGLELYDYPLIKIQLVPQLDKSGNPSKFGEYYVDGNKGKQGYGLNLKQWRWYSEFIDGKVSYLGAIDAGSKVRFQFGKTVKDQVSDESINIQLSTLGLVKPKDIYEYFKKYSFNQEEVKENLSKQLDGMA